jgi:signal transduction histidine kinase/ligand-binding sensor domain-containing protein
MNTDRWDTVWRGERRSHLELSAWLVWSLVVCAAAGLPAGASEYTVTVWQTEDGLPQNSVTSIVQSPDGYLWLATFNGLVRFDGARFTVFDEGNSPELQSSRLTRLDLDGDGGLWIITEEGALSRRSGGLFERFTIQPGGLAPGAAAVIRAPQGQILLLDRSGGVYRLEGKQWISDARYAFLRGNRISLFTDPEDQLWVWFRDKRTVGRLGSGQIGLLKGPDETTEAQVRALALSRKGGLWLVLGNEVWHYHCRRQEWQSTAWRLPECARALTGLLEDRAGNLWVGTYGSGLVLLEPSGSYQLFTAGAGLSHNAVRALWEDREGNIWAGTDGGGLARLCPRLVRMYSTRHGLSSDVVMSIAPNLEDTNSLWLGLNGGGINRLHEGQLTSVVLEPPLRTNSFVYGLLTDSEGGLWIGGYDDGLFRYYQGTLTQMRTPWVELSKPLLAGLADREGAVWLGGGFGLWRWDHGQFTSFNSQLGDSNVVVRALVRDEAGTLYVGTFGRGLSLCRNGKWTCYTEANGLADNHVSALYADAQGTLWIGTFNGGLSRFREGAFLNYSSEDGLPANCITGIVEDDYGHLWLGSNRGLFQVSKSQLDDSSPYHRRRLIGHIYHLKDGLSTLECGGGAQPAAWRTADGKVWFATIKGLASVEPSKLPHNPLPPPVAIEEVLIDGVDCELADTEGMEWVAPRSGNRSRQSARPAPTSTAERQKTARPVRGVLVPPRRDRTEFRFTGLSFLAPERVCFRYQLEGYDRDWIEAGPQRSAYYTHLPAGHYVFHVTACNDDGVWNPHGAALSVVVLRPWWMTWWFRGLTGLGIGGLVFGWYERRVQRLRREHSAQEVFSRRLIASQESERQRLAGELHDGMSQDLLIIASQAQLSLQQELNPPGTLARLKDIVETASHALQQARRMAHNLRPGLVEELGLTKAVRATVQKAAEASGLDVTATLAEVDSLLPPEFEVNLFRILQETLNNVLKHAEATKVQVRLTKDSGWLRLVIEDNGCGFELGRMDSDSSNRMGFGLRQIGERAKMMGGHSDIQSQPGRGTRLSVEVPLIRTGTARESVRKPGPKPQR